MWYVWLNSYFQLFMILALLGYKYLTYHYGKWKKLGVPFTEPIPLLGNLSDVIMGRKPLFDVLNSHYQRFDGHRYFGIFEARNAVLVVRDPELVHTMMIKDFTHFYDRKANKVSFEHDNLYDHLVNLRGEQWKAIRTKLSPTFTTAKLRLMMGDINVCTTRLVNNLNEQIINNDGVVNVSEASAKFTTDTIGSCAFGLDCNTLSDSDSDFCRVGRDVFATTRRSAILNIIRLIGIGRLLDVFKIRGLPDHIYDFFDHLLKTTMKQHANGENSRNDFIALLVKLKNEENLNGHEQKLFTNDILLANSFVFFVAGFETTATTISYCLYELALNPEIQEKLREEIKQTLNANKGKLSYDTIKYMTYLDMIINETLRMHPPVPNLVRVCTKKYTIPDSDITLNIHEKVLIPTYSLHFDPKYYPSPTIFDPERFTEENITSRPRGTFLPFGDGPRICIGMRFALMEIKIGLAEIISKFEVRPCKDTQIPIKIKPRSFLLTPNEPIRLTFKTI